MKEKKQKAQILLRGYLGEKLGKNEWNLAVKSVGEAIRAIDVLTKNALSKLLYTYDKLGVRYKVLINGNQYKAEHGNNLEDYKDSGLTIKRTLKSLEIIPILKGSGFADVLLTIVGAILIIAAIYVGGPYGALLFVVGAGLFGAGLANLLAKPPDVGEIEQKSENYLFNGPANVIGEGRPVPVGYGTLKVGSQRIAASYKVVFESAEHNDGTLGVKVC